MGSTWVTVAQATTGVHSPSQRVPTPGGQWSAAPVSDRLSQRESDQIRCRIQTLTRLGSNVAFTVATSSALTWLGST